jgi:alpha-ketoglutarate-dependent taurine dioxygenase
LTRALVSVSMAVKILVGPTTNAGKRWTEQGERIMPTLSVERLSDTVGAEVSAAQAGCLSSGGVQPEEVLEALETNGVLVFRDLNFDPETQVAFCSRLGAVDYSGSNHPVAGIYRISLDVTKNPMAEYLHSTFDWHIDGCTPLHGEYPQMATVLSAKSIAQSGGETEFASTYAAYDDLDEHERERLEELRVVHTFEASQRLRHPTPTDVQVARWRTRPASEHPLVWTHHSGRKSLVVGASADHVVGMDRDAGRALLADLLDRATRPERTYQHRWQVGDMVIWDNRGVLHRALPYAIDSPREMLRTTVLGDEPIQ